MNTKGTRCSTTIALLTAALLSACGGGGSGGGTPSPAPPEPESNRPFTVDQSILQGSPVLAGFDGGEQRPVAAVHDEELGVSTRFVETEIVVVTDDPDELNTLIEELDAEQLAVFDPASIGLADQPSEYLLRVDASGTETSDLAGILEDLGEEIDTQAEDAFPVSSQAGLELLALAARQRQAGHDVSPNWVGLANTFLDGNSLESDAEIAPANAFEWPTHGRGTTQDIDVVTAWQMLERTVDADSASASALTPGSVRIAILDGGFAPGLGEMGMNTAPNDFLPNGFLLSFWVAVNPLGFEPINTENLSDCGSPCRWHGTEVASAAMAVPDNGFGAAGPAGPIADPLFITTQVDRFSTLLSFNEAVARDARIINMSYSLYRSRLLAKSQGLTDDLDKYTRSLRQLGILAFASTPNNGEDFGSLPYSRVHVAPCHNAEVICVNGLMWDSRQRHPDSSYGGGIDIAAPYELWVGLTPENSQIHRARGNSVASPFAAGVAALVMYAEPNLSADEVETILMETVHDSPDATIPRYVNAAGAVRAALTQAGYAPIRIDITHPDEGDTIGRGTGFDLNADALDLDDGTPQVEWQLADGEVLGEGTSVSLGPDPFDATGEFTIVATASGTNGTASDEVTVTLSDVEPTMRITTPAAGTMFAANKMIPVSGTSFSPADIGPLPDADVEWFAGSATGPFGSGHDATLDASTLDVGSHPIRLVGTSGTETGQDEVTITIVSAEPDPAPFVRVDAPENGVIVNADQHDSALDDWYAEVTLQGTVTDNNGIPDSDIVWTTSLDGGPAQQLGIGTTLADVRLYADRGCGSKHTITLTATDSEGKQRSSSIVVTVDLLC